LGKKWHLSDEMKVILFGATGMIGQGLLRELLLDSGIELVLSVGRRATGQKHTRLREVVHRDFTDFSPIEEELTGFDACFFCLGVSSAGMSEADYRRVTYDFALAAAGALVKRNPRMTFLYISGAGTDSTERGRTMWGRVKGATENALLRLPFKAAYMFRPAYIQPLHGIQSSTKWTRAMYAVMGPLYPVWMTLFPKYVTTTEELGRAMIRVAKHGFRKPIIESGDVAEILRPK
jgi:uncharacterized protein YbjT (DUF2867 family)